MDEIFIDYTSLSTVECVDDLKGDTEICCPNCGSYTYLGDLKAEEEDNGISTTTCPLCRLEKEGV